MGRSGPKGNHYEHQNETVVGLRRDKKSGRFFPVGKGSPSFGSDPPSAVHRFRLWQAEQGEPDPLEARSFQEDLIVNELDAESLAALNPALLLDSPIVREVFRAHYRNLIYSNPSKAATELDCEPVALLANVENLKPPQPSKGLSELCDTYLADKTLSTDEATSSQTWWDEFRAITKARVVTDLDREAFKTYRKTIQNRQGDHSNVWVRSRFGKIKTIINHALVEIVLTGREKLILSDVALLKKPPRPAPKPCDISPKNMKAILAASDKWDKALILLALNAAYTNVDLARLEWRMVNFENGTIRFDRTKSVALANEPLPRICSLWTRTIRALEAIQNGHSNVFVSSRGEPPHRNTIGRRFGRCCVKAGVEDRTFKHLRKSALTAASNDPTVPDRQVNLLAGHSAGIKEHYVVRRNVELACEAIERYYFNRRKQ